MVAGRRCLILLAAKFRKAISDMPCGGGQADVNLNIVNPPSAPTHNERGAWLSLVNECDVSGVGRRLRPVIENAIPAEVASRRGR